MSCFTQSGNKIYGCRRSAYCKKQKTSFIYVCLFQCLNPSPFSSIPLGQHQFGYSLPFLERGHHLLKVYIKFYLALDTLFSPCQLQPLQVLSREWRTALTASLGCQNCTDASLVRLLNSYLSWCQIPSQGCQVYIPLAGFFDILLQNINRNCCMNECDGWETK